MRLACSAARYPLEALMHDVREYLATTGRRPTFEYTLLSGVNDSLTQVSSAWAAGSAGRPRAGCLMPAERGLPRSGRASHCMACLTDAVGLQAAQLAKLLHSVDGAMHVNLIPWNPVPGLAFERPSGNRSHAFAKELRRLRITTTLRDTRGMETAAACGQLQNIAAEPPAAPAELQPAALLA